MQAAMSAPYARPKQNTDEDHWPVRDTTFPQLRAAAKAWRRDQRCDDFIHDRIDELIDEIERLRKGGDRVK